MPEREKDKDKEDKEEKPTVLLVEDDKIFLRNYQEILTSMNIFKNIIVARDGSEAFSKFNNQKFDLMVADIVLPKLDGLKLVAQLKICVKFKDFPKIIFISGNLNPDLLKESLKLGVKHILAKPFTGEDLSKKIREVLNLPEGSPS